MNCAGAARFLAQRRSLSDAASASTAAADSVDVVIIGAGVIGLAVARALTNRLTSAHQRDVLVLDRASTIGSATSSRNSEVIHAGLYYPNPSSLKAHMCVLGKHLLYDYCRDRHIAHKKCGKLVVACHHQQINTLRQLQQQAIANGVHDTQLLTAAQVYERDPNLQSHSSTSSSSSNSISGALWSPSTGVIDSHALLHQLQADAEDSGHCTVVLNTAVESARINRVVARSSRHEDKSRTSSIQLWAGGMWISCQWVINCAGLWATPVARLFHSAASVWQPPRQYFAKGTYFRLKNNNSKNNNNNKLEFNHLIYPVPDPNGGLGVHLTVDCYNNVKFGPDVEWVDIDIEHDDPDAIDLTVNDHKADAFYKSIRTYWPDLADGALQADYVGIRPKLVHPMLLHSTQTSPTQGGGAAAAAPASLPFCDFAIACPKTHGVPGVIHLFGIESPGLTSSMAIAEHVANLVQHGP